MGKKIGIILGLLVLCLGYVSAQSFGAVTNDKADAEISINQDKGFTAQVDIDLNLFQWTQTRYSDAKNRDPLNRRIDSDITNNLPFGGFNILDDTLITFGYNADWFGGKFNINKNDGLSGIKAWVGFLGNKIKISAGNDIGYGYADSQGADAGLRVYDDNVRNGKDDGYNLADGSGDHSVDSNKNPDNITQDKGILFEFDFSPLKIAFAGGGNILDLASNHGNYASTVNNEPVYGFNFQYGLNAGYKIGEYAKANGAYILQARKDATKYEYNQRSDKIVAMGPDSEIWNHLFGFYTSIYPFRDASLGITLGYAGVLIQYLKEFSVDSETNTPQILKNGINLTARYNRDKLTIKTDHNVSFWTDKNYKIFYLYKPNANKWKDYGLEANSNANASISDVNHLFIWNGLGASYRFTDLLEGSVYARNLLRIDETGSYRLTNSYFSLELKSIFHISPNVEAYASIVYNYTGRTATKSLAEEIGEFGSNPAADTNDFVNMVKIPIGFTVKL